MLSVKHAQNIVMSSEFPVKTVRLPVMESLGMVLAQEIMSGDDIPAFDNSCVDGFAISSIDAKGADKSYPVRLTLLDEDIPAGKIPKCRINPGFCISIMTGAPIPEGADAVVMKEDTQRDASHILVFREIQKGENISCRGEDIKKGITVLSAGTVIYPAEIGVVASLGISEVEIYQPPAAGVIATGDELIEVDKKLEMGRVRDSNSYSLSSQLAEMGMKPIRYGIAKDQESTLKDSIDRALKECDILILSGGISGGEYDLVKDVLQDMGARLVFWKVSQIPGKTMAFFKLMGKFIFGLPGNPLAAMICFEMFIRPFIRKMMGYGELFRPMIMARASHEFNLEKGLTNFMRVFVSRKGDGLWFQSAGLQRSGSLSSMLCANGIAEFPENMNSAGKDTLVKIHLIKELT